jgi:ubiquinol-cytochrome c reductase cytochrome b subunit
MGFLDGALRIWPSWTFHSFGHTIAFNVFVPALVLPGLIFGLAYAWPMLERMYTKDNEIHHLLDRPSQRPKRTAAGVAALAFVTMLFIASSTDVIANFFHISLNTVLWLMRITTIVVPLIAYPIAYKICKEMQGVHGAGKRKTHNIVSRSVEGEYLATPTPAYSDDVGHDLEATVVPTFIESEPEEPDEGGVRIVDR